MIKSRDELRAEFLRLRASDSAPRALSLPPSGGGGGGARRLPGRKLTGDTPKERRAELMRELATRDGWSLEFYEQDGEPASVKHADGRTLHFSTPWNKKERAEISVGGMGCPSDGWSFRYDLEKRMELYGGTMRISVSLSRGLDDLLSDIDRRIAGPYAQAWPEVKALAEIHEAENRRAMAITLELTSISGGRQKGSDHKGRMQNRSHFDRGMLEVYPSRDGSEPEVRFERLSTTVEQAREICKLLNRKGSNDKD